MRKLKALAALLWVLPNLALADVTLAVTYLKLEQPRPPVLSNLDPIPGDLGLSGAELGLADNATTGRFLGHTYTLEVETVAEGGDWISAAQNALARSPFVILDAPPAAQIAVADLPEAIDAVLINISARDVALRDEACRANLLHTLPSNLMRSDALAQFMLRKRWSNVALISGTHPPDIAFAESLKRSLNKFGLTLRAEKTWAFDSDMRRNASQEVPLFTQGLGEYDLLLIADELGDFGRYIAFNTWLPRPVAGSEGLRPIAWSRVVEQWGAAQMQNRFRQLAGRDMRARDYAAWAAMRALGEAVTRTNSSDPQILKSYMLSGAFELAGFKGRKMSFRPWNGQLRQPIPLVTDRAVAAQAPLEGFLHQKTELDTLGIDAPETRCTAFKGD